MMVTEVKEALLYRKMPASTGRKSNGIQTMDAKTQQMQIIGEYGNIYIVTKNTETIPKYCLPLRLLTDHLLIHVGQSEDHHLNQVIKFSLTNREISFLIRCNVTCHICDIPNPDWDLASSLWLCGKQRSKGNGTRRKRSGQSRRGRYSTV